jgi:hypothetical protein
MLKFLGKRKKEIIFVAVFVVAGAVTAIAIMTGGDLSLLGMSSHTTGGDYTLDQSMGESIGVIKMAGGDYELLSTAANGAASKLRPTLKEARCYPNPYKPNSGLGHTRITFSYVTMHTKLRVYNVAGELVYDTEGDSPAERTYIF